MNTTPKPIKTVIIDDQRLMIDGLISLLKASKEVEVVGCTTKGKDAEQLIESLSPDVVLLDLRFKDQEIDGLDILSKLRPKFPNLKILILSSFDDFATLQLVFQKGGTGYLLKNTDTVELINAIKKVYSGERYAHPKLIEKLLPAFQPSTEEKPKDSLIDSTSPDIKESQYAPLTFRELEIARLRAKGMERKQIASQLFISKNTVGSHLTRIHAKLDINNVAELINWLIKKELIQI